jgi:hypothetical protein
MGFEISVQISGEEKKRVPSSGTESLTILRPSRKYKETKPNL